MFEKIYLEDINYIRTIVKKSTGIDPLKFVEELQKLGCGKL